MSKKLETEAKKEIKAEVFKGVEALRSENERSVKIFPDGFSIGVSKGGDAIILSFYVSVKDKPNLMNSYALTVTRAKDFLKTLQSQIQSCDEIVEKKKAPEKLPSGETRSGTEIKKT